MVDTSCVVRYISAVMARHTNLFRPRHIQRPTVTGCRHTHKRNGRMSEVKLKNTLSALGNKTKNTHAVLRQ